MHRDLVNGFFRNARGMLRASGEIHVNHKTTGPYCQWNIEELASQNSLTLAECVDFKKEDYPGYNNKRGDGSRCDKSFPLGECSTFKFRLSLKTKTSCRHLAPAVHGRSLQFQEIPVPMQQFSTSNNFSYPRAGHLTNVEQVSEDLCLPFATRRVPHLAPAVHGRSQQFQAIPVQMHQCPTSYDFNHPQASFLTNMEQISEDFRLPLTARRITHLASAAHGRSQRFQETPVEMQQFSTSNNFSNPRAGYSMNVEQISEDVQLPLTISARNECFGMIDGRLNNQTEMFGRNMIDSSYPFHAPRLHFRDSAEIPGRTLNGDTYVLRELQRWSYILGSMQQARLMLADSHRPNASGAQEPQYL